MHIFQRLTGYIALCALFLSIVGPSVANDVAHAAIAADDYFVLTAAGDATSMDSGATLVFTVEARDGSDAANTLAGADYAFIEIMSSDWQPSTTADITALGAGLAIKEVETPWGATTPTDVNGAANNLVAVNIADGTAVGNTFTVRATGTFNVFVWAQGAAINAEDEGGDFADDGTPPGQDFQRITVAAASGGADHLVADFGSTAAAEVGEPVTVTVNQVNSGGGLVTSALADVVLDLGAVPVAAGTLSATIESSADDDLGPYGIVKFTSAANPTAYYMASAVTNSTFKVMGGNANIIYSDSNIIPVTGLGAGAAVAVDGGETINKNTATTIATQGETVLVPGDIVSVAGSNPGQCGLRGYMSVISAVNDGADSTVTVMGPLNGFASCEVGAGNITKITLTDDGSPDLTYTVSNSTLANGYFYSVGGVATGNETTTKVSGKSLTNGTLSAVVVASGTGALTVLPYSPTVNVSLPTTDNYTAGAASTLTVVGYGPPAGQVGVPTMAPIDFMLSKDPGAGFPLTNTADSNLSLTAGGTAVAGSWYKVVDTWGENTFYRVTFKADAPMAASTLHTASIKKSFASATGLPEGMTPLTDTETAYTFAFTTGAAGGNFEGGEFGDGGGGFTGTMGGEFPPIAMLGYPQPGSWDVPTNVASVVVNFDRPMDASTLTTSNIYIRKLVNGLESAPAGTPVVTPNSDNDAVTITGYTFEANSEYRVIVTRSVLDNAGTQLAGMPVDDGGNTLNGFGFGFANMGPFKENFHTGAGASVITAALLGLNIDQYKASGSITGVPTGSLIRANFNNPLNSATVNSTNVTLKKNGSVPVAGSVYYDAMGNSAEFVPSAPLSASTSYTFAMSTAVTSVSGTAITQITQLFTTGTADATDPTVAFADADNYGIRVQFDEPLVKTTAENRSFYTIKTCSAQGVNANGVKCADNSTDPTAVSLLSGVTAHYEKSKNEVWMDGLTFTAGDGFYVELATGVTDISGNGVDATAKSWTGFVMDSGNFQGGQGMFNMGSMGFEDFNMSDMGMKPINVMPMNTMAGATTKYFLNIPISTQIPADGYVVLTFPSGFTVSGAKRDADSPMNNDFNGPASGTPTFDNAVTSLTGFTDGGGAQANDGIGYINSARKVGIQLSAATQANDFLHIDLDGIKNSSEPKNFDTSGYQVDIKTYNSSGTLLEAMTSMPFFISPSGAYNVSGTVNVGATGLNGVKVFLDSPMTGPMEVTTANNAAGGGQDGEYKFDNLGAGQYMVRTEPVFAVGPTDYYGQQWPEPLTVDGNETKNFTVTAAAAAAGTAPLPVAINFGTLPTNVGFNNSIDIFAGGPGGFVVKTISRSDLVSNETGYEYTLYLPTAGKWFVGIGPAMPKGTMSVMPEMNWMPPKPADLTVAAANIGNPPATPLSAVSFTISTPDKTIAGKVVDGSGTAIANAEIFAYSPQKGTGSNTKSNVDGTFSLGVTEGTYKIGAFLPGMPQSQEVPVLVSGSSVFVDGSSTASTGSTGANPFQLKIAKPSLTVQGRVSDGTSPIANAAVWAYRTDSPAPPINVMTDSSGNYTLYVSSGTWKVESDAPGYGYVGSKTLTMSGSSLTGQNFTVTTASLGTITGSVGSTAGAMVSAYGPAGGNKAKTDSSGAYTIKVPAGTYTVEAFVPGTGSLAPLTAVVTAGNTTSGKNFVLGTTRAVTVTLKDGEGANTTVTGDVFVDFFGANGKGNHISIPAGSSSATLNLVDGTYYVHADVPGVDDDSLTIAGAGFADGQVTVDGAEAITVTVPALYTLSGQVANAGGTGINETWISVNRNGRFFGTLSANNAAGGALDGEYSIKVPAGTYSVSADKPGYSSRPVDITVSANTPNQNFVMTANDKTIQGTVTDGSSNPVSNAFVWAKGNGGGFAKSKTAPDGTYTLSVKSGIWTVNSTGEGYSEGTALSVDTSSASQTGKNFSLTALSGGAVLKQPKTESIVPSSGGTVLDSDTNAKVVIPPNALGSGSNSGQLQTNETNQVVSTPSATPLGNGQAITATASDGTPITTLNDDVTISLELDLSDLSGQSITTAAGVDQINNAYWDDSTDNWVPLSTSKVYYDDENAVIASTTVAAADTLTAAGVDHVTFSSATDHFTTFAPIVSSGATPPDAPTGLAASAGDSQVTLSWTANSEGDMDYYNIWEANVTEGVLTTFSQAGCSGGACSKVISSLTNGTAYAFQIIAVDTDANQSAGSSAVSSTPVATAVVTPGGGGGVVLGGGGGGSRSTDDSSDDASDDSTAAAEAVSAERSIPAVRAELVAKFEDTNAHWAKTYIEDLFSRGVISGKTDKKFAPEDKITRAELTKIALNSFGISVPDSVNSSSFKDVAKSDWYARFIETAAQLGVLQGYDDQTFAPNREINRAEALKILIEASGVTADQLTAAGGDFEDVSFKDVGNAWYGPYVSYGVRRGFVKGYDDGTFRPGQNISRAEAAKIAVMLMQTQQ